MFFFCAIPLVEEFYQFCHYLRDGRGVEEWGKKERPEESFGRGNIEVGVKGF